MLTFFLCFLITCNETLPNDKETEQNSTGNSLNQEKSADQKISDEHFDDYDPRNPEYYDKMNDDYQEYMRYREMYYENYGDPELVWDENGKPVCGPNATLVESVCECNEGFPFGKAQSAEGCYNCKEKCSDWGTCEYPGVCQCYAGYYGDGLTCSMLVPNIVGINDEQKGYINILISNNGDIPITEGYCRFGDEVVKAEEADNRHFLCRINTKILHPISLAISSNGKNWTNSPYQYSPDYVSNPSTPKSKYFYIVLFVIIMIVLTIALSNARPVQTEEYQPFIRERPKKRREFV